MDVSSGNNLVAFQKEQKKLSITELPVWVGNASPCSITFSLTFVSSLYDTSLITLLPLRILLPAPDFDFFSNTELKMWSFLDSILSSLLFSIHICSAMGWKSVSPLPRIHMLKFWSWGFWDDKVLRVESSGIGLVLLYKRPGEHPYHFYLVTIHQENSCLWSRKHTLTRYWICWHIDLRFPSLYICEKWMAIVYKPPSPWYSVIAVWTKTSFTDDLSVILVICWCRLYFSFSFFNYLTPH